DGPAGRHGRRDRADAPLARGREAPERRAPAAPPSRGFDRGQEGPAGERDLSMLEIGLSHYLSLAAILFTIGIFGIFLNRKNVIVILMSVELILLAVNIN